MSKPTDNGVKVPQDIDKDIQALLSDVTAINTAQDASAASALAEMDEIEKAVAASTAKVGKIADDLDSLEEEATNELDRLAIEEAEDLASI